MARISVSSVTTLIISFVVIALLLGALTPVFMNSMSTFSETVGNYTELSPVKPLVDALPLLVILAICIGLVFTTIALFKGR